MRKLTPKEAEEFIVKAYNRDKRLRFGQALWDSLDLEIIEQYAIYDEYGFAFYDRNVDFFSWEDTKLAVDTFYKYFVEEDKDEQN